MENVEEYTTIQSIFIRERNCLMLRGKFAPIFTDYYLNLMESHVREEPELDAIFKPFLAYFTLHLVARPWAERHAWTATLRSPLSNFFATGAPYDASVVGRIFSENVREPKQNTLYAQLYREGAEPRTSTVPLNSNSPVEWIETFYDHSEQRPCRAFELPDEEFVLITAQPDADLDWLSSLTAERVATIDADEQTKLLESRKFRFHCGCSIEKILPILNPWKDNLDELFGDDIKVEINCPRCAARYKVTREMLTAPEPGDTLPSPEPEEDK